LRQARKYTGKNCREFAQEIIERLSVYLTPAQCR
jgi:hypothetical protein